MSKDCSSKEVFISHAIEDEELARAVKQALQIRGIESFVANMDIKIGDLFKNEIQNNLKNCKALVIILTPNSINKSWVAIECGIAWAKKKKIYPLVQYVDPPDSFDIISDVQHADISTPEQFNRAVDNISGQCSPSNNKIITWNKLQNFLTEFIKYLKMDSQSHGYCPDIIISSGNRGAVCAGLLSELSPVITPNILLAVRSRKDFNLGGFKDSELIENRINSIVGTDPIEICVVEYLRGSGNTYKKIKDAINSCKKNIALKSIAVALNENWIKENKCIDDEIRKVVSYKGEETYYGLKYRDLIIDPWDIRSIT